MRTIHIAVFILLLSGSLMAQAPVNPGQNGRRSQVRPNPAQMDTDGDGKISSAEWSGPADMFARLDSNSDGYITRDEIRQQNGNAQAMDTNNDGRISRDEWKGPSDVFDRVDANHDGFITSDERPQNGQRNGQNGPRPGSRGQGAAGRALDTNNDGVISRDEWNGPAEVFDRLDADRSGSIERGEARSARGARGQR